MSHIQSVAASNHITHSNIKSDNSRVNSSKYHTNQPSKPASNASSGFNQSTLESLINLITQLIEQLSSGEKHLKGGNSDSSQHSGGANRQGGDAGSQRDATPSSLTVQSNDTQQKPSIESNELAQTGSNSEASKPGVDEEPRLRTTDFEKSGDTGNPIGPIGVDPVGAGGPRFPDDGTRPKHLECQACTPGPVTRSISANSNATPNASDFADRFPKKDFGDTTINRHFQHTFNLDALDLDLDKKPTSGKLTLEVENGSGSFNDMFHVVADDSNGRRSLQQQEVDLAGRPTGTLEIDLNPAALASLQDGDFSFFVADDTTVVSATLEINGFGKPEPIVQSGTASDDTLDGNTQVTDFIHGNEGDDDIHGRSGNDCLYGDKGDDRVDGGSGDDYVYGDEGGDQVEGGDDQVEGGSGDDFVYGMSGDDKVHGGSGNDYVSGGRGDDVIHGGSGNDRIDAFRGSDTVNGGSGNDFIYSGLGDRASDGGINTIDGGSGQDTVRYFGDKSDYNISPPPGFAGPDDVYTVTHLATGLTDTIQNVEHLRFFGRNGLETVDLQ